ncbi:MAG: response regulator [Bdellovibrionales bacterium]|nr:response regulator [Bdellovibrionales bacterium]
MKKILVVDDEMELVQLYRLVLEDAGYDVNGAYNGRQALRLVDEHKPHLILLDVMMPGMDGIEVCRQIRDKGDDYSTCKIIMYTADDSVETRTSSIEAGANDLVSKEVPIYELTIKIRRYLHQNGTTSVPAN